MLSESYAYNKIMIVYMLLNNSFFKYKIVKAAIVLKSIMIFTIKNDESSKIF